MFPVKPHARKSSSLIIGLVLLAMVFVITTTIPPENPGIMIIFFLLLFLSLFYLLSFCFNHRRRALLTALTITIYFFLRLVHLRHWSYLLVVSLIIIGVEHYFTNRHKKHTPVRQYKT